MEQAAPYQEEGEASPPWPPPPGLLEPLARGLFVGIGTGFLGILLTLAVAGLALDRSHRAIEARLDHIMSVQEPISAAAYEMEINVLGAGLAVLKYLDTGDPQHRDRIRKDEADFARFKAEYDRLAQTPGQKALADEVAALHQRYHLVAAELMGLRDQRTALHSEVAARFVEIDAILDEELQAGLALLPFQTQDWQAKLLESSALESDVAEVGTWLGNYLATSHAPYRERVPDNLADVRGHLAALQQLQLSATERAQVERVATIVEGVDVDIGMILDLHDSLREGEQEFVALRGELDDLLDEEIQALTRRDLAAGEAEAATHMRRVRQASRVLVGVGILVCVVAAAVILRRSLQLQAAEAELRASIERRRSAEAQRATLLQRLLSVQEEERSRIARELHDEMGQELSALMLGLESLRRSGPVATREAAAPAGELRRLQEITERLMDDVHSVARELRPATLDHLGLHGAILNLVEDWTERSGIPVDLHSELEGSRLPWETETTLYRVVQEALTNVHKHAKARAVGVVLQRLADQVRLVVEDDGCGLEVASVLRPASREGRLGLLGMRERVTLAGGSLEVESTPGRGTSILVRIPIPAGDLRGVSA